MARLLAGLKLLLVVVALATTVAGRLDGQVGLTTDIITGVVTTADGTPVADAVVDAVSLETQISRSARTDARGRYTILFPDGGGQYRVTARAIGLSPRQALLQRYEDEDRLVWNVQLMEGAVTLDELQVTARRGAVQIPERPTPGSTERLLTPDLVSRLPIETADVNLLATLVPGILGIPGSDSTANAFSVAGQRADANAITLDGLLFGSGLIPPDGVRSTRVITSTFDVSRGGFSGGLVSSTTRGGSNVLQGSSGYVLRDDALAIETGEEASPFGDAFTQHQLSGGLGGPIVHNRVFVFASGLAQVRNDPQPNLLSATLSDLPRLGVNPDSVDRFMDLVSATGVNPLSVPAISNRDRNNYSGMMRFDYLLGNAHTMTLRGDWRGTVTDPSRVGSLALPQTGGSNTNSGGGGMLSMTSRFGVSLLNEGRVYLSGSSRDNTPFTQLPGGRVQVASDLPDGALGVTTLSFGGGQAVQTSSTKTLDVTDELSWIPGTGQHRVKLGVSFRSNRSTNSQTGNAYGTFSYNSLADFEANRPASFRRTLNPTERNSTAFDYAAYLGDVWYASRPLQLTYGVRVEGSGFSGTPQYNPVVDSVFGRRTDALPSELHLSPRIGFTWTIGASNPNTRGGGFGIGRAPTLILRGGIGEFRSPIPANLVASAQAAPGLESTEAEISCIGAEVPIPDWTAYAADQANIPTSCLGFGGPAVPAPSRTVVLFADDYAAPRSWRGSLSLQRNLTSLLRLSVSSSFARGVSQYGFTDLNLLSAPQFQLAHEGSRPVYAGLDDIDPGSGAVRFTGSRIDSRFGQILETRSDLASQSEQLTVSLGGFTRRGIQVQGSYTWQRSRDQLSSSRGGGDGFGGATTAGDPNVREWARSDFERRHSFLATITYPFGVSLELTGIGRLMSGSPFTPMVGSDINGDGSRNDRAFVFAGGSGSSVAESMERLLASSSAGISSCLERQIGVVAARNSCTGPWQGTFDLQLNWRPNILGLGRRLAISLTTVNMLRGVDELVHGADDAKGWGLTLRPDPTLLYVTGFDSDTREFQYTVNERFGATGSGANALRSPFQVGIQVRMTIGPDRGRAAVDGLRGGGRGGFGGGAGGGRAGGGGDGPGGGAFAGIAGAAGNPEELLTRLNAIMPNPAAAALEMRGTLLLDDRQVTLLESIRDSLAATNLSVATAISAELEKAGANPDFRQMAQILQPRLQEMRTHLTKALEDVQSILTPFQWSKLPESVRNPATRFGGRPGGGQQRPPN
jgi:hypothetical protein